MKKMRISSGDVASIIAELRSRLLRTSSAGPEIAASVGAIVADVAKRGDAALIEYTRKFDGVALNAGDLRVSEEEIERAFDEADADLVRVIKRSAENIRAFHKKQLQNTWMDVSSGRTVGQLVMPLESAGVYVPGGRAAYPSSVLMNVIPAKIAGVKRIAMVTPPQADGSVYPLTLVAAKEAGADEIYRVGGAQAVAALAYGTKSIARVDKITGPGNIFVTLAKREVFGIVGIDMTAGPSEVLIIADSSARPEYIAADMLAQAEHDPLAAAILITDDGDLALSAQKCLEEQLSKLPREKIARDSIVNHGTIVIVENLDQAVELSNQIAPEHLELMVAAPFDLLGKIRNAGAIFLGEHTPEPVGDYFAGPNHVLPTDSTARFFSPLSVDDFVKKSSVLHYTRDALREAYEDIASFALAEGLHAHARSAKIRFEEDV